MTLVELEEIGYLVIKEEKREAVGSYGIPLGYPQLRTILSKLAMGKNIRYHFANKHYRDRINMEIGQSKEVQTKLLKLASEYYKIEIPMPKIIKKKGTANENKNR